MTGKDRVAEVSLGAGVRSLALDATAARAQAGALIAGCADGSLHIIGFSIVGGTPRFELLSRTPLSDGAITAAAFDPAGFAVAGGTDGQLWVVSGNAAPRAISPGGDGGVRAIACLGDGRAAVGCGDGSIRTCFLVGDVEAHDRSGDHGHQAAVRGFALGPVAVDDAGREQPRRLFSVGDDGALKSWLVDGNRRPRSIELGIGAATAVAFAPGPVANVDKAAGRLWIASTTRKLATVTLGADVDLVGEPQVIGSTLDLHEAALRDAGVAAKVKLETVAKLTDIAEDEARVLLDLALASGPPEVRVAATQAMVRSNRRLSRPALRTALGAVQPELRGAAFHALLDLEADQPLAAIRVARTAANEDVRLRAVDALAPLAKSSVIAAGLVADSLRDAHPSVRRRAFAVLRSIAADPLDAIRTALSRGTPDVRAEALLNLGFVVRASDAVARTIALGAFDDADAGVRTSAFLASLMQRPSLAARINATVPSIAQSFQQLSQSMGLPLVLPPDSPGDLDDDDLEPVFAALACRNADAAIRGAGCLLALNDARSIGAILQLTRESDPALRRGATHNLIAALMRWPDDERLSTRLYWLLDDADADVRNLAFDAVAKIAAAGGPPGELDLAEIALRGSQEDVRVRALQILVRVGAPGSPLTARADALLGDALDDEAAKVRGEAFRTLWAWHSAEPLVPLARGARSRHGDLRGQVVVEIERRRTAKQGTPEMDRILLGLVGDPVATVGLGAYAALTRAPAETPDLEIPPAIHVAAMASPVAAVRAAGAKGAAKAPAATVRGRLVQLVKDDHREVFLAAIEALDAVAPNDAEGFVLAFGSLYYELQVRAGELCGARRDARAIAPMKRLLSIPKTDMNRPADVFRQRAARALADVGDPSAIPFLQGLTDDEDPVVREMGARGVATAAQPGNDAPLVALLAHPDLPVRSWGGEGLAKLGDVRALPVLAGTQKHDHRPLRIGAIVGFVALGPEGVRGLRQGLEDRDKEIADLAFAVIAARDVALAAAGIEPDLLVDAMSSPSPEIRFAAARLFEMRAAGTALPPDVVGDIVGPRKPDKAADIKDWPAPERRTAILQVLADAIASDDPAQRYAAAQVLALRSQPLAFWREAGRLAGPTRSAPAPHTSWSTEGRVARKAGWLRKLVTRGAARDPEATELEGLARMFLRAGAEPRIDAAAAHRLVFGVYAGLIRQAPARGEADETHRVRRDAVGRLVELAREDAVGVDAVLPVLGHAVGDPHHLVRQAAMAALRSLYPTGALAPLAQAIGAAADLGKAAIDELVPLAVDGDARARALVEGALDASHAEVRAHAAMRLSRLYPPGSAAPQLLAARSRHADVRLAAITELASANDPSPAITDALISALGSEHSDLRLAAAVALAKRGGEAGSSGVDVLAAFLRSEDEADDAIDALTDLGGSAAAEAIAARLDDDPDRTADRDALVSALDTIRHESALPALIRLLVVLPADADAAEEQREVADTVWDAIDSILVDRDAKEVTLPDGRTRQPVREAIATPTLSELARSPTVDDRAKAAERLGNVEARAAEDTLARLLADRDPAVRTAAGEALALRAYSFSSATLAPLEAALRGGRRELVLPAALGLAGRKRPEAFQPLMLVAKAGEGDERERAVVALGSLGDRRALDYLLPLLDPAPDDTSSRELQPAAIEALGRLLSALSGDEAAEIRARVERIALAGSANQRERAITGLRYAGDDRARGVIERVASDRDASDDIRQHAIQQLAFIASPASETVLAELLSDDDYDIRSAAMEALTKVLGGDRTRTSLHALGVRFEEIAGPAARYLATAGDPATLVERLGSVDSASVRAMLREGLIRRGALPRPQLETALASTDPRPRGVAAWIAGAGGDAARPLGDAIAAAVARSEAGWRAASRDPARETDEAEAWRASLWAARRVGSSGAVAVESAAIQAVRDDRAPPVVRREAAEVLATAGSTPGLAALAQVAGDRDRQVRAVASRAIASRAGAATIVVRAQGSRADATTIAPLAWAAWPELARELVTEPATRTWALAVSLSGHRVAGSSRSPPRRPLARIRAGSRRSTRSDARAVTTRRPRSKRSSPIPAKTPPCARPPTRR